MVCWIAQAWEAGRAFEVIVPANACPEIAASTIMDAAKVEILLIARRPYCLMIAPGSKELRVTAYEYELDAGRFSLKNYNEFAGPAAAQRRPCDDANPRSDFRCHG